MKIFARFIFICFWGLTFSFHGKGQIPGSLDTSFGIRPNYGAVFSPHQVFPLKDGRTLCFTDLGNFFNGKRTGSFFRLLPNGDLDEAFQTPVIHLGCYSSFCACESSTSIIPCQDGGAILFHYGGLTINGKSSQLTCLRIKSDGQIDSTIQQISGMPLVGFTYFKPAGAGFLAWKSQSNQLYWISEDFSQDSVLMVGQGPASWLQFVPGSSGGMNLILWDSNNVARYLPYYFETKTIGEPVAKFPGSGSPLFLDKNGRLYEAFYFPQGKIRRRSFATGLLDSLFEIQCGMTINYPDSIFIAGDGTVRKRLGQGKYLRYHPTTGDPMDTVKNELDFQFLVPGGWLKLGFNSENRWEWRKTDSIHQTQLSRFTRFGANGPIRQAKLMPDGKYVIDGSFSNYDGWHSPGFARIKPKGWVDSSFSCSLFFQNINPRELPFFQFLSDLNRIIIITTRKINGSFIHYLFPDGSLDQSFVHQSFSGFNDTIHQVFGAERLPSGNFLVLAQTSLNPAKLQVFKLGPNGAVISIFQNMVTSQVFPGINEVHLTNSQAFGKIKKVNDLNYYLDVTYTYPVQPNPPCRPDKFFETNTNTVAVVFDTLGHFNPNMPFVPYQSNNISVGRTWEESISPYIKIIRNFKQVIVRLTENVVEDTTFILRMPQQYQFSYYNTWKPILQCQSSDILMNENQLLHPDSEIFYMTIFNPEMGYTLKVDNYGQYDSLFQQNTLRGKVENAIEPDSSHILIFGDFQTFGNNHTPYIARLHNKSTLVAGKKQPEQMEMAIIFPNPASNQIYIKNWRPGMELQLVNQLGQIVFTKVQETNFFPVPEGLSNGLYFWTIKQNGQQRGHGKLLVSK